MQCGAERSEVTCDEIWDRLVFPLVPMFLLYFLFLCLLMLVRFLGRSFMCSCVRLFVCVCLFACSFVRLFKLFVCVVVCFFGCSCVRVFVCLSVCLFCFVMFCFVVFRFVLV